MAWRSKLWELMSEEQKQQEREWAHQLYESRVWFVNHVKEGLRFSRDPIARKAVYNHWREKYGDDRARGPAKYVEACIKGTVTIEPLEKMISSGPPKDSDYM